MTQALVFISLALSVASMILHVIAPLTKTTKDDKALEVVDAAKDMLPKK